MVLVLCAALPFIARSAPPESKTFGDIKIRHLAAGKKVIPAVTRISHWEIVDIKLPDVVIENRGKRPITIQSIDAIGRDGEKVIATVRLQQEELTAEARKAARLLENPYIPSLQLALGDIVLPAGKVADSRKIGPGESAVLTLSKVAFLHYTGHSRVETMDLAVKIWNGKKSGILQYPVKLTHFEQKGNYIFPLKGDIHMAQIPLSYIHHRGSHSQEFAFDAVGAAQKGIDFTGISTPNPKTLSDFGIWGREVYAVGDGTVVETGDKFPEKLMSDPAVYEKPGYATKLVRDLSGKIGFTNAVAGNYIVIDHHNGEFSTYCHLKEGSLRVKEGDRVKKGAVIAQVGNTGNSGAPHLHFQIMDGKSFTKSNGLPVMFENLKTDAIIVEYPAKANVIGFSDSVYYTVK